MSKEEAFNETEEDLTIKQLLIGSFLFGLVALIVSIVVAGGGHGSPFPIYLFFPLPMLLSHLFSANFEIVFLISAIVQYPLYVPIYRKINSPILWGLFLVIHIGISITLMVFFL